MNQTQSLPDWLTDPVTNTIDVVNEAAIPTALIPWVYLANSMTQQITDHFGQQPAVAVHFSGLTKTRDWETSLLNLSQDKPTGYARHISLAINHRPVLAARSITRNGNTIEPLLAGLNTTPLARLLFENPLWLRKGPTLPLIDKCGNIGRASTWHAKDSSECLIVEEFFLFQP